MAHLKTAMRGSGQTQVRQQTATAESASLQLASRDTSPDEGMTHQRRCQRDVTSK